MSENHSPAAADKFVVRMPNGMRRRIEQLAADRYTSMNTEIIQAIEANLKGRTRQAILLEALEAALAQQPAELKAIA